MPNQTGIPCVTAYLDQAETLFRHAIETPQRNLDALRGVRISYGYGRKYIIELFVDYGVRNGHQFNRLMVALYLRDEHKTDRLRLHFFRIEKNFDLTPI
jgi:hypothetical protein